MKNLSLNQLYDKIDKSIRLLEAHTEINKLSFVIRACRLKPWFVLEDDILSLNKLVLHHQWFDEFNNSVEITKKHKLLITHNDLKISHTKNICTDLYNGLSLDKIYKISKLMHLYIGYDNNELFSYVTFMGIDNFFRTYYLYENNWLRCSPLMLESHRILNICEHLDIKFFLNFRKKNNNLFPCENGEEWISFLPVSTEFSTVLAKQYDTNVFNFFNCK